VLVVAWSLDLIVVEAQHNLAFTNIFRQTVNKMFWHLPIGCGNILWKIMSSYLKLIHIDIWAFLGSVPGLKLSLVSPNKAWAWLGQLAHHVNRSGGY